MKPYRFPPVALRSSLCLLMPVLLMVSVAVVQGDETVEVLTADGRQLVGVVTSASDAPVVNLVVSQGAIRAILHIPATEVTAIRPWKDPHAEAVQGLLSTIADTTDGEAVWAVAVQMESLDRLEYRELLRRVVTLAPDHAAARAALGQRQYEGQWLTEPEIRREQGFIYHQGEWLTEEAYVAVRASEAEAEVARLQARRDREIRAEMRARSRQIAASNAQPYTPLYSSGVRNSYWGSFGTRYRHCPYGQSTQNSTSHGQGGIHVVVNW